MNINFSNYRRFYLVLVQAFLFSCTKDEFISKESNINFGGITTTDVQGVPILIDSTDWNTDDSWNDKEAKLFNKKFKTDCLPGFEYFIGIFPNPNNGNFMVILDKPDNAIFDLRLVDRTYNVVLSKDSVASKQFNLNLTNITKDTFRMYYKFINAGCEFRGHGDIVFK